ncbi:bifunctional folylpolyglutamate synthase/dihydrofolate synthase [Prolixibacteraceae bacterium JC049]|nr:bifunctional folylpolyglutamate synthase/dihydrofolate synthase [Prolixibacteraceae bacterium JC049]
MNYKETLDYLYRQLPMYQRQGGAAYKNNLDNTIRLDNLYGSPHKNFKTIHVGGTNGKGSVSHMLAAILQKAGYKTGLYTSPHLKDFRERIRVNGEMISEQQVVDFVADFQEKQTKTHDLSPSFFEFTVAMAFQYFDEQQVDVAIIEVGMGGRLDSTNIISPELSVITNISHDHTAFLGESTKEIAGEKAGIIKSNTPVIVGEYQAATEKVFANKAKEMDAPIVWADSIYRSSYSMQGINGRQLFNFQHKGQMRYASLELDLLGKYQGKNVATALVAIEQLIEAGWNITKDDIYKGLFDVTETTGLMGRWQVLGNNPLIVCDTGHNEAGLNEVLTQIDNTPYQNLHIVLGLVNDKNIDSILEMLPQNAIYYFTKAQIPRALNERELAEKAMVYELQGKTFPTVEAAFEAAKKSALRNDLVFVGGSTFVVAEVL